MRKKLLQLLVLVIPILAAITSCNRSDDVPKTKGSVVKIDPTLNKISTYVALMEFNVRLNEMISCKMEESFQSIAPNSNFARELVAVSVRSCELAKQYVKATKPTYDAMRAQGRRLDRLYAFIVVNTGTEDPEEEIGLFADLASCKSIEAIAHERGEATRRCFEWKDAPTRIGIKGD